MDSRKKILINTVILLAGTLLCSAAMCGIFALFNALSSAVVLSAIAGCCVITLNYFIMAVTVSLATDRAAAGDAKRAQNMVQLSSVIRLICMGAVLFVGIKLGANVIALVLPLAFMRPVLMIVEFFRKEG